MTTWYAQNASQNINAAWNGHPTMWNSAADGSGSWLTWANLAADDNLNANGKNAITINVSFTCAQICSASSGMGGSFYVSNGVTVTANVLGGVVAAIQGNASGVSFSITGNVTGGLSSAAGIALASEFDGTLSITGNVSGGSGSSSRGLSIASSTAITVNVTGNVTGSSGTSAHGIFDSYGTSTIHITGNVTAGNATGCSGIFVNGTDYGTGLVTVTNGNLIDNQHAAAVCARRVYFNPSATNYHQYYTGTGSSTMYPGSALPDAKYVYNGINRGDGITGTLRASNIHSGAGAPGVDLSADILKSGITVDDVAGSLTSGGTLVGKSSRVG